MPASSVSCCYLVLLPLEFTPCELLWAKEPLHLTRTSTMASSPSLLTLCLFLVMEARVNRHALLPLPYIFSGNVLGLSLPRPARLYVPPQLHTHKDTCTTLHPLSLLSFFFYFPHQGPGLYPLSLRVWYHTTGALL